MTMRRKTICGGLACLVAAALVLAACAPTATTTSPTVPSTAAPSTTVPPVTGQPPAGGDWWRAAFGEPEYGGTISFRMTSDPTCWDPYFYTTATYLSLWEEPLGSISWTSDRKNFDYRTRVRPAEVWSGLIAESWEWPDFKTVIAHIRQGIHFFNKPPLNGRELNAYDVVYHYSRLRGLGQFEGKGSVYRAHPQFASFKSVTAIDKWTVRFEWDKPNMDGLELFSEDWNYHHIVPREAVEASGGTITDWQKTMGTGPFMVEDYVSGSSLTCVRNPNYWQYDQRYPKNRLPYVDKVRALIIKDDATAFAALRTGKLDFLGSIKPEQALSFKRTNPELLQAKVAAAGTGIGYREGAKPFNDIRVRKALSMAIDREALASSFYGGIISGTPCGLISPYNKGYYPKYEDWPQDVKEGYKYNPKAAKQLLAEAGYPNGFKTNIITPSNFDIALAELIKSWFADVGVDMEIKVVEANAADALVKKGAYDQMRANGAHTAHEALPTNQFMHYSPTMTNYYYDIADPVFDKLVLDFYAAPSVEEAKRLSTAADMRWISQYDSLLMLSLGTVVAWQPYLKGFLGEAYNTGDHFAHWWINQQLKK